MRMEDDSGICPCKPFYGVVGGVSPRIRVSYRIHDFRPSEGRFPLFPVPSAPDATGMPATPSRCGHPPRERESAYTTHCGHADNPVTTNCRHLRTRTKRTTPEAGGDVRNVGRRFTTRGEPRPPFPACFQVTHHEKYWKTKDCGDFHEPASNAVHVNVAWHQRHRPRHTECPPMPALSATLPRPAA